MSKEVKNIGKSIRDKLTNISRVSGKSPQVISMLYTMERFLYRLSISKYRDHFILKGGLFLYSITETKTRPTKDIDFLAKQLKNDLDNIAEKIAEVISIGVDPDGIIFDPTTIRSTKIKEDANYEGVRINLVAKIDTMKVPLQFDIGFGDIIVPSAVDFDFPTIFEAMERPNILVYSVESVISEKFEAMISLAELNTRMKDFYDIHTLLHGRDFEGRVLQEAIAETLQNRTTIVEKDHVLFSEQFANDTKRSTDWGIFLKRSGIESVDFPQVMSCIIRFLQPVYLAVLEEREFFHHWSCEQQEWHLH